MKKQLLFSLFVLCTLLMSAQGNIGIVGPAANGWPDAANQTPDIMLTNNGDGTHFIAALTLNTGAAKFRTDMDWANPSYGADSFPTGTISNSDINVVAGVYDILVDLNNNVITFTDVATFTDVELVGSAITNGSTPQLSTVDGVNYSLSVTQFTAGTVQFREVGTSNTLGSIDFPAGTATAGGAAIPIPTGFYQLTYNLTTGAYNFELPVVGLVGPALNGWPDANNPTPDVVMNTTDGDSYTLDNQPLLGDVMKFRQNRAWNVSWGGVFADGVADTAGGDIQAVAGTYDIAFSRSNLTFAFVPVTASIDGNSFDRFKVYPNPTSDRWFFENPTVSIKNIVIYDNLGKLILELQPDAIRGEVNTSVLTPGLYIAQISLTDGSKTTVKLYRN